MASLPHSEVVCPWDVVGLPRSGHLYGLLQQLHCCGMPKGGVRKPDKWAKRNQRTEVKKQVVEALAAVALPRSSVASSSNTSCSCSSSSSSTSSTDKSSTSSTSSVGEDKGSRAARLAEHEAAIARLRDKDKEPV